MGGFSIEVDDHELRQTLQVLEDRITDLTPLWPVIGEIIRTSVIDTFEAEGRPQRWAPLSPLTQKFREADGQLGNKILGITGRLANSIAVEGHADGVTEITPSSLLIGTNLVYARIHQEGGTIRPKKREALNVRGILLSKVVIPARPFLQVLPEDEEEITATIEDWLKEPVQ